MSRKLLMVLCATLAVTAFAMMPAAGQAAPRWFIDGVKAGTKHELAFAFGKILLTSAALPNFECENFVAGNAWNEVKEGTERGFEETTGYGTWECKTAAPCQVLNERGIRKEGIFVTAEEPPEVHSEKAHHNGDTSLPWNGELIEKEPETGVVNKYVLTHHIKVWIVVPLGTEMGGTGVGEGCALGGHEIAYFDTEKEGLELAPKTVNGSKNGLTPSHGVFEGKKTEKSGALETGGLESEFGAGFPTGSLLVEAAPDDLVTAK